MNTAFREVICGGFVVHPEVLRDQLREDLKADQAFTKSLSIDTMRYQRGRHVMRFVVGIVVVLHGLVHLLYFAQSRRFFELQPGMVWPDGSWASSRLLGLEANRWLAGIGCVLAALGFLGSGAAILLGQAWWRPLIVGSAIFSAAVFVFFWNGRGQNLDEQGLFAILINAAILISVLIFQWPDLGI